MLVWIVYVSLLWSSVDCIGSSNYECGEHGRFEYCIDGIPGCVVGCHCHPGYYFDTETKICEPNAKLVHEYRQLYETTLTPQALQDSDEVETVATTTTPITKDADELGNWLYNQFFKTIENKVINKTDEPPKKPTRRRGDFKLPVEVSRRSRHKKSRHRKSSLRKRLHKIAESSDDSSDDSSSSGSSSDSDSSSDTSSSKEKKDQKGKDDDDEHGHRKIVVINKKPKPPLPSFIFLPNFETPFYPPIGLPPPPAMPMYPMVPVPPMMAFPGPLLPPPMMENGTASSAAPITPPDSAASPPPPPPPAVPTTSPSQVPPEGAQAPISPGPTNNEPPGEIKDIGRIARHRKGLRNPMTFPNYRTQHRRSRPHAEETWGDMLNTDVTELPALNEVNFKYLSQLIHKAGGKNEKHTGLEHSSPSSIGTSHGLAGDINLKTRRVQDDPEQAYYSELGHKIATMIRTIDAKRDQPTDSDAPSHSMRNDPIQQNLFQPQGSDSPRSYWERFVRSSIPLKDSRRDESDENLFDIENEVESTAISEKPLSLGELENTLVQMSKAKSKTLQKIKNKGKIKDSTLNSYNTDSNRSWNVNLLRTVENRYQDQKLKKPLEGSQIRPSSQKSLPNLYQKANKKPVNIMNPTYAPLVQYRTLSLKNDTSTMENYINSYNKLRELLMRNYGLIVNEGMKANRNIYATRVNSIRPKNMPNENKNFDKGITKSMPLKSEIRPNRRPTHSQPEITTNMEEVRRKEPTKQLDIWSYMNQLDWPVQKPHIVQKVKMLNKFPIYEMSNYYGPEYSQLFPNDDYEKPVVPKTGLYLSPPIVRTPDRPQSYFQYQSDVADDFH